MGKGLVKVKKYLDFGYTEFYLYTCGESKNA